MSNDPDFEKRFQHHVEFMLEQQARFDERQNKMEATQEQQAKAIDGILKASADLIEAARINSKHIKELRESVKQTAESVNALLRIVDGHIANHP